MQHLRKRSHGAAGAGVSVQTPIVPPFPSLVEFMFKGSVTCGAEYMVLEEQLMDDTTDRAIRIDEVVS